MIGKITTSTVQNKSQQSIKEDFKVAEIGRVVSVANTIQVKLLEKIQFNNVIQDNVVVECRAVLGSSNKGRQHNIKVDDFVMVLFTDLNYNEFFEGRSDIVRNPQKQKQKHSLNNGIILGVISRDLVVGNDVLFKNDCKVGVSDNEKIILQNANENLKAINNTLIDKIKELVDVIKGLETASGGFLNGATLDAVNFDEIKTKNNNLFE